MAFPAILAALGASKEVTGAMSTASSVAGMASLGKASSFLSSKLASIPNQFTEVANSIVSLKDAFIGAFTAFTKVISLPIDAIGDLGNAIGKFVKLSNPALLERFNLRIEDAMAAIGRGFEPMLIALTQSMMKLGDEFAKLKPATTEAFTALGQVTTAFVDSLLPLFKEMAPLIIMQARIWGLMATALTKIGSPLVGLIKIMERAGLINLGRNGYDPNQSALNGAVRSHRIVTSADELQRETASKALSTVTANDPVKQATIETPNKLDMILQLLEQTFKQFSLDQMIARIKDSLISGAKGGNPVWMAGEGIASLIRSQFTR